MPGFVNAFLMLGFTEFLETGRRIIWTMGLLVCLQGGRLGGVGEDEVDEDGGEEEEASHHREGQGEASNLVQSTTNHRSDDLSCGRTLTIPPSPPSVLFLIHYSGISQPISIGLNDFLLDDNEIF